MEGLPKDFVMVYGELWDKVWKWGNRHAELPEESDDLAWSHYHGHLLEILRLGRPVSIEQGEIISPKLVTTIAEKASSHEPHEQVPLADHALRCVQFLIVAPVKRCKHHIKNHSSTNQWEQHNDNLYKPLQLLLSLQLFRIRLHLIFDTHPCWEPVIGCYYVENIYHRYV